MNFYDFHIGDYASRTAHLDPMEDLAYRRLLDLYYVREKMLPFDPSECARLIRMKDHQAAVKTVLLEFFIALDDEKGWAHDRCERVIAAAADKRTKAQASAALRWDNERNANAMRPHSESNAPSPSPSPTTQKKDSAVALLLSEGIEEPIAGDFVAMRKVKKAPLSATALKRLKSEAAKAGMGLREVIEMCCSRGWAGFEAKWVLDGRATPTSTVPGRKEPDPELERIKNHRGAPIPENVRAVMGGILKGAH